MTALVPVAGLDLLAQAVGTRTPVSGGIGAALASGFVLAAITAVVAVTTFSIITTKTARGEWFVRRGLDGSIDMKRTSTWRMNVGVLLLAAAAVVGVLGYLKISLETLVAAQIVYLASAGFGVVVLAVAGGALIVSDSLRADEHRIGELESSVAMLGRTVAGDVQDAPRLLDRSES